MLELSESDGEVVRCFLEATADAAERHADRLVRDADAAAHDRRVEPADDLKPLLARTRSPLGWLLDAMQVQRPFTLSVHVHAPQLGPRLWPIGRRWTSRLHATLAR